jgi:Reverse transcriptase (RNA-dependent DNA polymerase)
MGRRVAKSGLRLGMTSTPRWNLPIPSKTQPQLREPLAAALQDLLAKGAVEPCRRSQVHHFSPFFGVQQGSKFRPILDARELNDHIPDQHFKMEGLPTIAELLEKDWWLTKLDLTDAYLTVPVDPKDRRYLGFSWEGKFYRFKVLPFGVKSAPRLFTKLMKPLLVKARAKGLRVTQYIDDFCLISPSREAALEQSRWLAELLECHGFLVNRKKSTLDSPSRCQEFLGTVVNTEKMTFSLSHEKMAKVEANARQLLRDSSPSTRKLASILGYLQSARMAISPTHIMTRYLGKAKDASVRPGRNWSTTRATLSEEARQELLWWTQEARLYNGTPVRPTAPEVTLTTDASKLGWGCVAGSRSLQGKWSTEDASRPSNYRELKAVALSLESLAPSLAGSHVRIRTDNTCTMWSVRRQGSAKSPALLSLVKQIWKTALRFGLTLTMEYIPGEENTEADRLSRILPRDDYQLRPAAITLLQREMGPLTLDLFAEEGTTALPQFVSWRTQGGLYHDAFSRPFPSEGGLAHPPPKLIGRVLQKLTVERTPRLVLVTPNWKSLPHLPILRQLALKSLALPRSMLDGPPSHRLEKLRCGLTAWLLCGTR